MSEKKTKKKRLVLLDAHAIIHRAYHALPDFTSASGEPTGALYGLSAMLLKLIKDLKPDYLAACYDLPEPTYRHEAYKEYKAGRAKTDDALADQLGRSREVFEAFNIPIYEYKGFEADDMLGTIVEQMKKKKDLDIVIASGDMDTLQLVDGKAVQVYTLKKGLSETILYDEEAVAARFGFPPKLLPDYKGLRGDPSDNIIGISGIGEKTATTLITAFGTIESLYKTLKKKGGADALLKKGIKERVVALLTEHEEEALFSKMLATIRRDAPIVFTLPEKRWEESFDAAAALALFSALSFRSLRERLLAQFGTAAASGGGGAASEPKKDEEETPDADEVKKTAIALWLLRSDITNPTLDDIFEYAKTRVFSKARTLILKELHEKGLTRVYEDIELPLIPVVLKMEARGILVDRAYLAALSKEYHAELSAIEKKVYAHAGGEFNINSPKQLGDILFEKLGLSAKNQKRTGTGARSTRESELLKMRDAHPIIAEVLAHRELQKLLSTYIDVIPDMTDAEGRLHAQFIQAGTTTGRMSSQNPNLQNIPIKTELGRKIRNAFVAADGFVLAALDYSQIELRVAAFLSGDEKLIEVFKSGGDIHRAVASEVFGVPEERVDAEMRRRAKVINFGMQYGMGTNALRQNLGTSLEEAKRFYREYFEKFKGLESYLASVRAETAKRGYTETFFGRRRYFEGIRSRLPFVRAQAERMAINAPIQGTQADIIKIAMARVDRHLVQSKLDADAYLLLQVHDELVYEIRKEKAASLIPEIKRIMESVLPLEKTKGVPLIAEAAVGANWGEMKKSI